MALIKCPHCGQSVSDTIDVCIHCGNNIVHTAEISAPEKQIEYNDLDGFEKRQLWDEFQKSYPNQKNYEQREKNLKLIEKISTGCIFVGLAIVVLVYLISRNSITTLAVAGMILGVLLFVVSDIIDFSCVFLIRKNKKKSLVALKMFQQWLKDHKGINYTVIFSQADEKWKTYFDGVNLALEGYKG